MDGKGSTIEGIVIKEDAGGVVKISADCMAIPYEVSIYSPPYSVLANTLAVFCPSHNLNCTPFFIFN